MDDPPGEGWLVAGRAGGGTLADPRGALTGPIEMAILAIMETATITEVKNGLSAIIDRVKAGESILVTDRGVPVAIIEPATGRLNIEDRLASLERRGLIKRGTGESPIELMRTPGPTPRDGADAVAYVLEERREGR